MRASWAAIFAILLVLPAPCLGWTGKVVGVMDGDTLEVLRDGRAVRLRLYGVDCPEKRQDFGRKAKEFTSSKVFGSKVRVEPRATDRYGRTVALVFPEGSPASLNQMLVENGLAWVYRKYCSESFCSEWLDLERQARDRRLGLWGHPNPVPPWEFRRHGAGPTARPSPASASGFCSCDRDMDCRDFRSQSDAQRCFEHCMAQTGKDIHRLDRDGNGRACESFPYAN